MKCVYVVNSVQRSRGMCGAAAAHAAKCMARAAVVIVGGARFTDGRMGTNTTLEKSHSSRAAKHDCLKRRRKIL